MQTEQYGERTAVLAQLGHPRDGHRRILVMIEVYVDESGLHDGARALVVAGYWGSPAAWKRFEGGWMAALRRHGVHLHEFHARNLFPRRGRFADPGLDCDVLEDELLKAIESAKIHPFAQVLDVDEFWHLSERERRYLTGAIPNGPNVEDAGRPKRPYWVPFYGVLDLICGTHVPVGSKAHFFYGIDRPARQYAQEVFAQIKNDEAPYARPSWSDRVGTPSAPMAAETPHLQAADTIAYLIWAGADRSFSEGRETMSVRDEPYGRQRFRALKNNRGRREFTVLDRVGLDALLADFRQSDASDGQVAGGGA